MSKRLTSASNRTLASSRLLTDDELDKLVIRTFRINQATLREMDGVTDHIQFVLDEA
jgi:hypothetical protein